jgi:serine/threonine protein kinase
LLKTILGTYGYMAPEQHLGREYNGEKVDVFALGIILFLIYCNHPPFNAAIPKDPYYVALASKNYDYFWKKHSENKPNGEEFFPPEFKELF